MPEIDREQTKELLVLATQLEYLRYDVRAVQDDLRNHIIARNEWAQRNAHVDSKFTSQGREIEQIKTGILSKSAPWWSYTTAFAAVGALLWAMFGPTI